MVKKSFLGIMVILIYVTGLSFCISKEAEQAIEVLKSTDAAVRRRAAVKLSGLRSREAVPSLIEALEDEDFGVRTNAADALGNLRDKRAVKPLIKILKDKNNSVRISAVVALGFIRAKEAVKPVIDVLLKDSNIGVRISAAQVLGVLGDKNAIKPLINALFQKDTRIRAQAARSLGRLKAAEAAGPLADIAEDEEEKSIRNYAIESLGEIKTAESLKTLKKLLKSKHLEIAVNAAASLGKLGENKGLNIALEGIGADDVMVRRRAVMAISYIGLKNKAVVKAIKEAAKDTDSRVRRRAEFVAKSMDIDLKEVEEKKEQ